MLIRFDKDATALDIKILKLDGIKAYCELPKEYIEDTPNIFRDHMGRIWIDIAYKRHELRPGDLMLKDDWYNVVLPVIRDSGDKLHEIMKRTPRPRNERIVTMVI